MIYFALRNSNGLAQDFYEIFNPNGPHGSLEQVHLMLERQVLAWRSFSKVGYYGKIWLKKKLIFGLNFDISAIVYCCYRQPNWNTGNLLGNTLEAPNFLKIGLYFWEINWIVFLRNKLDYIFENFSGKLKFPSKPTSAKNSKLSTFLYSTIVIPISF